MTLKKNNRHSSATLRLLTPVVEIIAVGLVGRSCYLSCGTTRQFFIDVPADIASGVAAV